MFRNRAKPETLRFGRTDWSDPHYPAVRITRSDGRPVGILTKCLDGSADLPEWYVRPEEGYEYLDCDFGSILRDAQTEVRDMVARQDRQEGSA